MKVMEVMEGGDMTPKVGVQANFEAVDLSDQAQAEWPRKFVVVHRSIQGSQNRILTSFICVYTTLQRTFRSTSKKILFFCWAGSQARFFWFQSLLVATSFCQVGRFCDALGDQAIHSLVLAAGVTALEAREDWRLHVPCMSLNSDSRWDLICWSHMHHAPTMSATVQRWGNLRWLWNALWPQLPFALQHGRHGKIEMQWKVQGLFRASCVNYVNSNSGMWGNLCSTTSPFAIFISKYSIALWLYHIYFIPKGQNALASQNFDSIESFWRRFVRVEEAKKNSRTVRHSPWNSLWSPVRSLVWWRTSRGVARERILAK